MQYNSSSVTIDNQHTCHEWAVVREAEGAGKEHAHGSVQVLIGHLEQVVQELARGVGEDRELVVGGTPGGGVQVTHRLLQLLQQEAV